jgi:hypothetical protein
MTIISGALVFAGAHLLENRSTRAFSRSRRSHQRASKAFVAAENRVNAASKAAGISFQSTLQMAVSHALTADPGGLPRHRFVAAVNWAVHELFEQEDSTIT